MGKELVYLDSASSAQKPAMVIQAISDFYAKAYANVGRGSYWPAYQVTENYEEVRQKVASFIQAQAHQIVFTAGTTDAINKLVQTVVLPQLRKGDRIFISEMEHHSNLVPWQMVCQQVGAEIEVIPILENGCIDMQQLKEKLSKGAAFVAITAISNVLGEVNDIPQICQWAHQAGAKVFVDAAQSAAFGLVDVNDWQADFIAFSAHKLYGPTGLGVIFLNDDLVDEIAPLAYGGGMIRKVEMQESDFRKGPQRHEAGTPNTAGVIGLGAAIDFLRQFSRNEIREHIHSLTDYAVGQLQTMKGCRLLGGTQKFGLVSFIIEGIHPHDLSTLLNEEGICIRAGHHCTQPLHQKLKIPASARISFGIYNGESDINRLISGIEKVKSILL